MKRLFRLAILLPVLATAAIVLAGIGWLQQGKSPGDALFAALRVLSAGGDYEKSSEWSGNNWIGVARWLGLTFFALTALKAFRLLLARQWREVRAQYASRDLVFIGDHPVLGLMARLLATRRSVLWFAGAGGTLLEGVHVVDRAWQHTMVRRYRLKRAKAVLTAYRDDDLRGLTTAKALAAELEGVELALLSAALSVPSGLALATDLDRVRILSPEQLAIRSAHEAYPPFEIARTLGQPRIHALVLGCGRTGERVIADLLLSSFTTFLQRPRITVVDPKAEALRTSLSVRAPELGESADLSFVASPASGDPHALPLHELREAFGKSPFTCAYVCVNGDQASLAAALALDELARREGWQLGVIFVRQQDSAALSLPGAEAALGRLVPIGRADQLADSLGLLGGEPDQWARNFHSAYREATHAPVSANIRWEDLPETLRDANRQAIAHAPAKLSSAGISIEAWLAARRRRDPAAALPNFSQLDEDPELLSQLAILEHERWMVERRLAGWRYAQTRDDTRRLHPDLVPFSQLSDHSKQYDYLMVQTLAKSLSAGASH